MFKVNVFCPFYYHCKKTLEEICDSDNYRAISLCSCLNKIGALWLNMGIFCQPQAYSSHISSSIPLQCVVWHGKKW